MSNYEFLRRFKSDGRSIPELSQIYHHVYFRDLNADWLAANDLMSKCVGVSHAAELEKLNYRDVMNAADGLETILANDQSVIDSQQTKILNESVIIENQCQSYLSIKAPLYGDNEIVGLCGISLPAENYNLNNFMNILTMISKLLQQDWSTTSKFNLYKSTRRTKPSLTPREMDCLHFYMVGNSVKNIASTLGLSHRTIESYLENIKSKLGVNKRSELLPLAFSLYPDLL